MENDLKILFSNDQGWNKINYNNKSIIYKGTYTIIILQI